MSSQDVKTALVIGHPGHELRVFHWLETAKPNVYVITNGAGRLGVSRLPSTSRILEQVEAKHGSFYGRMSDAAAYSAILSCNFVPFLELARELARSLIEEQISYVAGDALEGYNPTHDACRIVINAAVRMINESSSREIGNYDFPLTGPPNVAGPTGLRGSIDLRLDEEAFRRKITAARSYAELDAEVEAAISENRVDAFRSEHLRPVNMNHVGLNGEKSYYELYGEKQVAAGHYRNVIRYRDHFLPLAEALARQADNGI